MQGPLGVGVGLLLVHHPEVALCFVECLWFLFTFPVRPYKLKLTVHRLDRYPRTKVPSGLDSLFGSPFHLDFDLVISYYPVSSIPKKKKLPVNFCCFQWDSGQNYLVCLHFWKQNRLVIKILRAFVKTLVSLVYTKDSVSPSVKKSFKIATNCGICINEVCRTIESWIKIVFNYSALF